MDASTWAAVGCGILRGMNDVSADADPNSGAAVYDSAGSRPAWFVVGGTSLSAPLIAGVYGLAANSSTVNYPASLAYAHPGSLRDITSAGNLPGTRAFPCTVVRQCTAQAGYDLPTGLAVRRDSQVSNGGRNGARHRNGRRRRNARMS
jgi:hypothetical protein